MVAWTAQAIVGALRELGLQVRAGLHTGECEIVDGKVAGIAVHIDACIIENDVGRDILCPFQRFGQRLQIASVIRGVRQGRIQI